MPVDEVRERLQREADLLHHAAEEAIEKVREYDRAQEPVLPFGERRRALRAVEG